MKSTKIILGYLSLLCLLCVFIGCSYSPKRLEMGNTTGNALLGGIVAYKHNWTYFSNKAGVFRTKDNKNFNQLTDTPGQSLNVCDGWIYYTVSKFIQAGISGETRQVIRKMRIDGKRDQRLGDDYAQNLLVVGNLVYYQRYMDGFLCCMKIDGSEKKVITNFRCQLPAVDGEWRYAFAQGNIKGFYRFKADGSELQRVNDVGGTCANIWDGLLYFINGDDGKRICRMRLDGSVKETVGDLHASLMQIDSGWLYFVDEDPLNKSALARFELTKKEKQIIYNLPNVNTFAVVNDKLYIELSGQKNDEGIRMQLDGSNIQCLP